MKKSLRLYKKEKLCSVVAIDRLFCRDGIDFSHLCYPLRAVARLNPGRSSDAPIQFLISVPKKRLRHAVDRVKMRRRIREAYRLTIRDIQLEDGVRLDLGFIYVANDLTPYPVVYRAVKRLLLRIAQKYPSTHALSPDETSAEVH